MPAIASSPEDLLTEHVEHLNACLRTGLNDGVRVVTVIDTSQESATSDYAWRSAPKPVAGRMILKWDGKSITRMTVTL